MPIPYEEWTAEEARRAWQVNELLGRSPGGPRPAAPDPAAEKLRQALADIEASRARSAANYPAPRPEGHADPPSLGTAPRPAWDVLVHITNLDMGDNGLVSVSENLSDLLTLAIAQAGLRNLLAALTALGVISRIEPTSPGPR